MIKVLHIVEAFTGGVVTYLQGLINGLDDEFASYILYACRDETPKNLDQCFKEGTVLRQSKYLTRAIRPKADLQAFMEVRQTVKDIKPDIVHLHSSKASVIGRWALNGKKIPLFYTPNGYSFLMNDCSALKKKIYYYLEALSGKRRCTTIACGQGEYKLSLTVAKSVTYVNNGINTAELDDIVQSELTSAPLSICTLARITRQKNPLLFNQIAEKFPDIRFVWIGDGELRHQLTSPNIEIVGWLPKKDALRKMMESEVFLLPSLWEGLPLSVLETMYLKRICVVSNISGNLDIVVHDSNGFLCDTLDDYVKVIEGLVINGFDEKIKVNAHETIIRDFSQDVMVKQYAKIYREAYRKNHANQEV